MSHPPVSRPSPSPAATVLLRARGMIAVLALCAAPASAFQAVHVVNGGSGTLLQSVIDAAADGDTILVHGGSFDACQILGKGLTIVSEPDNSTLLQGLRIAGTSTAQRTTIAGLTVLAPPLTSQANPPPHCIVLDQCAGSVRLENVVASLQVPNGNPALRVTSCPDVALAACVLTGSDGAPSTVNPPAAWAAGAGVLSALSQIAAYDTTAVGGRGNNAIIFDFCSFPNPYVFPPTPGAAGVRLDVTATWFSSGGTARGGNGGRGLNAYCSCFTAQLVPGTNGAAGGAGIDNAATATVNVLGTVLQSGAGGLGGSNANCGSGPGGGGGPGAAGPASTNPLNSIAGTPLQLVAPTRVRAAQPLPITVTGNPGDVVLLGRSFQTRWLPAYAMKGVLLTGPSGRRVPLGVIPATGTVSLSVPTGLLPVGVLVQQWYLQVFARDPFGALQVGAPFVTTVLDPAF